jgi:hypothetical protein
MHTNNEPLPLDQCASKLIHWDAAVTANRKEHDRLMEQAAALDAYIEQHGHTIDETRERAVGTDGEGARLTMTATNTDIG